MGSTSSSAGSQAEAGTVEKLVAAFLRAADSLPCETAAASAGVRPETIRKWRRRLPRSLKMQIRNRLAAYLAGEEPVTPRDGFDRAFQRTLRRHPVE